MKRIKPIIARNAAELALLLGLNLADGMGIEFRSDLNSKVIEVVKKKGLSHAQVAKLAITTRTRINGKSSPGPVFFSDS